MFEDFANLDPCVLFITLKICVVVSLQDSHVSHLGHDKTKPVFVFSDKMRFKPACSVLETS